MGKKEYPFLQNIYEGSVARLAYRILNDPSLDSEFDQLPSGRRYRAHKCKTNCLKLSVIPKSITLLNKQTSWFSYVSQ